MAAANFSRDVIEMFYGSIEENQRLPTPISPSIRGGFEIVRNNFNEWLRVWKMQVKSGNKDLFKFFQKTKNSFINVCTHKVDTMKSVKIQFGLLVRFYMIRDEERQQMDHYFNRMQPVILNEHNMDMLSPSLNQFVDEVKGEIEAWSERGSGWIMDEILEAFINVARYQPLLYDQNRHNESKHFCERCLHGYKTRDLLERHKPECKGLLKSPTRTNMPKQGENKMSFTNYHKQMKAPYVVYADFECLVRKMATCEPDKKQSFTVKTEKHEPCGFSYVVVRSDGQTFGPYTYRGEDAVFIFLRYLQNHEMEMRKDMENKRPLVMTNEDWQKYKRAGECHICNKSLHKDLYLDSMAVYDPDSEKYSGQSHRRCYHQAVNNRYVPHERRQPKDAIDQWIANTQETCLFCADPLLVPNFKDSVRDHDHMTGNYRGAAHNECNFKLKLGFREKSNASRQTPKNTSHFHSET